MANGRVGRSAAGVASFVFSVVSAVLLVILGALVYLAASNNPSDPSGADESGYGFLMFMLVMGTLLCQVGAFGLGVASVLQRRRGRTFAFLGIACSVFAVTTILALAGPVNLARLVAGAVETQPKVHGPSPDNN